MRSASNRRSRCARPPTSPTPPRALTSTCTSPRKPQAGLDRTAASLDAAITFPAGLAVNPSQAAGLGACSEPQIGFEEATEGGTASTPPRRRRACPTRPRSAPSKPPRPCWSRATTDHEVEKDPEDNPVPEALHGSVYIAKPFANPFGSLIAIYLVIEDEKTGIVAKLAGKGELDPQTGQITTCFKENPELPLEDIKVHLFGGSRGAFITPPTCGQLHHRTRCSPPGAPPKAKTPSPKRASQTTRPPRRRALPHAREAQLPNAPKLDRRHRKPPRRASTARCSSSSPAKTAPSASAGSKPPCPAGLSAKLAGVAHLLGSRHRQGPLARSNPRRARSSRPTPAAPPPRKSARSIAAAGAGPTPYYTTGHAYLAGPYKGAPLSIVAIAPAVAGPFDLGTVVIEDRPLPRPRHRPGPRRLRSAAHRSSTASRSTCARSRCAPSGRASRSTRPPATESPSAG